MAPGVFLEGREGNLQVIHLTNSTYERVSVKKKEVKWEERVTGILLFI